MTFQSVFKRYEKKYLLNASQYRALRSQIDPRTTPDVYGDSNIRNLYFDTNDHRLIRHSLEKPPYKEKLRLRSYGVPNNNSTVFVEIKKKFQGIVYKRRIPMTYEDACSYLLQHNKPEETSQILLELDWMQRQYPNLSPAMMISYDRTACFASDDPNLRLTFDHNLLWREHHLTLDAQNTGSPLLRTGEVLLEIKIPGAMPLWLAHILDDISIYPTSYSKYGEAFLTTQETESRGNFYAS